MRLDSGFMVWFAGEASAVLAITCLQEWILRRGVASRRMTRGKGRVIPRLSSCMQSQNAECISVGS